MRHPSMCSSLWIVVFVHLSMFSFGAIIFDTRGALNRLKKGLNRIRGSCKQCFYNRMATRGAS